MKYFPLTVKSLIKSCEMYYLWKFSKTFFKNTLWVPIPHLLIRSPILWPTTDEGGLVARDSTLSTSVVSSIASDFAPWLVVGDYALWLVFVVGYASLAMGVAN